jgi:CDP-paratose 2-epimerase
MKKIFVTGGAGLVGSHVAEFYAKQGVEVIVFDNLGRSKIFSSSHPSVEHNIEYLKGLGSIRFVQGDIRNFEEVKGALAGGVDAVVHAAAQPGVQFSIDHPLEDFAINAIGTINVLEAARVCSPKAPFIYCSANKIYGGNVGQIPIQETSNRYVYQNGRTVDETFSTDHTAHTPYGVSKYTGDLYVQEYAKAFGMRTGVFRMSCIYGPRQFGFEDQGWLSHFAISTLKKRPLTIYGDGKQVRDCLYVEDLVRAFDHFIQGQGESNVYNIGGGSHFTLSLLELVGLLEEQLKYRPDVRFKPWRLADQKVYISDISRVQAALDWEPKVEPQEGLRQLLEWAQKNIQLFK